MTGRAATAAAALALCAGCAAARPPLPPPAPPPRSADPLTVTLLWSAPVDLDLYVTDPASVTLYFANNPTATGMLLADARCADVAGAAGGAREVAGFTEPPPGTYRIGVDFIDTCGRPPAPVAFRVVADVAGRRHEVVGTIGPEQFEPVVLEVEMPARPGAGPEDPR
jgi:hypothetical protein